MCHGPINLFRVRMDDGAEEAVSATLRSGYVGQGPRVEEFEEALQALEGAPRRPIATTSATHALDLAYHLCGVGPGTSVVTTPMTCLATNMPIALRGAEIIWADIDQATGLIDPGDVARVVRDDTVAIVGVDWASRMADYPALRKIGPPVIQDGAHSLLAGRGPDYWGDYRVWSFQAIKHLTCGDGGALLVPEGQGRRAELLRWYGLDRRKSASMRCVQDVEEAGYKYGMNDIAASIGLANMRGAPVAVARHRANAEYLYEALRGEGLYLAPFDPLCSYWFFPLLFSADDSSPSIEERFGEWDIESSRVHDNNEPKRCFREFAGKREYPGLEKFCRWQTNVPCGWWLSKPELERIVTAAVRTGVH